MIGPCAFPCNNKTEFNYCKTTACIYAPTIIVSPRPQTHADRIRAKSDEELAELLANIEAIAYERLGYKTDRASYKKVWLEWLKKEAYNG